MSDKMILGEDAVYSMDSRQTGLNNNVIVCGSSGCGKTMSVSEPLLLETNEKSVIATVTKRRLVHKYAEMFRRKGYRVMDLNFISPAESEVGYDPMRYIQCDADITFLAEQIVAMNAGKNGRISKDPYWDHSSVSLLSAEIGYVYETMCRKGSKGSLRDVLELHDELKIEDGTVRAIRTSLDEKFDELRTENRRTGKYRMTLSNWDSFRQMPAKTARSIYGSLNNILDSVFTPELRAIFGKQRSVNFRTLAERKTVLFVSSSAVNPSIHGFVNLFYAQAFKELFEIAEGQPDGRLPVPVHMLCDDFATGGRIKDFAEFISIFREKQISVTLLIQSESQLEGMYGASDATTIINNCDTYMYMGGMDLKTVSSISERMNIPLDEVLYMPVGQVIIMRRGERPRTTRRYDIENDERYRKVTAAYEEKIGERDH